MTLAFGKIKKKVVLHFFLLTIVVFFLNIFVLFWIKQERYIYFWDISRSWDMSRDLLLSVTKKPLFSTLRLIYSSINTMEYNYLPFVFLMPFYLLLGSGREVHILSLANTFFLPSIFVYCFLFRKIIGKEISLFLASVFLIFPLLIIPVLMGYEDIIAIVLINLILCLFLPEFEKKGRRVLVLLGILLALLAIVRRYFVIWVISFLTVAVFLEVIKDFCKYRLGDRTATQFTRRLGYLAFSFLVFTLIISGRYWLTILNTNYSHIYSAYKSENSFFRELIFNFNQLFTRFGLIFCLISLGGVFYGLLNKKFRLVVFLLLPHFLLTISLFSRIQDLSIQHLYLFIPSLIIFVNIFNTMVVSRLSNSFQRSLYLVIIFGFSFLFCLSKFDNRLIFRNPPVNLFFGDYHYSPQKREDIPQVKEMVSTIKNLLSKQDGDLYVLASSSTLNDDILREACYETEEFRAPICERIMLTAHVDERDGFPENLHKAKYIVTTEPVQYHLRQSSQRVIGLPSEELLNSTGFGQDFDRLGKDFMLEGNVRAYIYERKAGVNNELILENLSELESKIFIKTDK